MLTPSADGIPHRRVWERVWVHPDVQIQPLDAETLDKATRARLWMDGAIAASLHQAGGRWEVSSAARPDIPKSYGSTALAAATNWLLPSEENQS